MRALEAKPARAAATGGEVMMRVAALQPWTPWGRTTLDSSSCSSKTRMQSSRGKKVMMETGRWQPAAGPPLAGNSAR